MPAETLDVKPTEASSASNVTQDNKTAVESEKPAINTLDAALTKAITEAVSPIAKDVVDKETEQKTEETKDESKTAEDTVDKAEAEKDSNQSEESTEEKTEETEQNEDTKDPVPYERFAEVNSKSVELASWKEQVTPLVESYNSIVGFCQTNGISPDQYKAWMEIAAEANNNPVKAVATLKGLVSQLQQYDADVLPKDLQELVEKGDLKIEHAKRLAKAEAEKRFESFQSHRARQTQLQREQAELTNQYTTSIKTFIETKQKNDPDFKPKSGDAPDGPFEWFLSNLQLRATPDKVNTPADLVSLADSIYSSVKASIGKLVRLPVQSQKTVRSSQAQSAKNNGKPKSVEEVILRAAAKAPRSSLSRPR